MAILFRKNGRDSVSFRWGKEDKLTWGRFKRMVEEIVKDEETLVNFDIIDEGYELDSLSMWLEEDTVYISG